MNSLRAAASVPGRQFGVNFEGGTDNRGNWSAPGRPDGNRPVYKWPCQGRHRPGLTVFSDDLTDLECRYQGSFINSFGKLQAVRGITCRAAAASGSR